MKSTSLNTLRTWYTHVNIHMCRRVFLIYFYLVWQWPNLIFSLYAKQKTKVKDYLLLSQGMNVTLDCKRVLIALSRIDPSSNMLIFISTPKHIEILDTTLFCVECSLCNSLLGMGITIVSSAHLARMTFKDPANVDLHESKSAVLIAMPCLKTWCCHIRIW